MKRDINKLAKNLIKEFYVFTCEHRRYRVKANSKKEANNYLQEKADLTPKDKRVTLETFGDFEIVE
jgi:hypothetical protein